MGFDLKKYWDGQPVRFYCASGSSAAKRRHADEPLTSGKNNKTDEVAFVVEFQIESLDA